MKKFILSVVVCVVIAGCGVKKEYLKDSFNYRDAYMGEMRIYPISIVDERKNTGARRFEIPGFSWKGAEDSISPALTEVQKAVISDEVRKHSSENGRKYSLTVFVQKGTKSFKTKRANASEAVEFSVKLSLTDGTDIRESSGEALLEISSLKASNDYLEQLYRKAIREAIHKAFAGLKK